MSLSNATIHNVRLDSHFTITDNRTPEDPRLSWAAKGVLWYILSRSYDWQIHTSQLSSIYQGKKKGGGLDAIKEIIKELRAAGYVKYTKLRNAKGEWHHRYDVYPIPHSDFQKIYPERDLPALGSPSVVNPPVLPRTDNNAAAAIACTREEKSKEKDLEIIKTTDTKGREKTHSVFEITKYLRECHYSDEVINEALNETRSYKNPISNALMYIDSICRRIKSENSKKTEYNKKGNSWNHKQQKSHRKQYSNQEDMKTLKKQSMDCKDPTMVQDMSEHPFLIWPSRLKKQK